MTSTENITKTSREYAYEIEVDYGTLGHTWDKGSLPAAALAKLLRDEADRVEAENSVFEAEDARAALSQEDRDALDAENLRLKLADVAAREG